ncbi:Methylase involved in ubiquinone/menaquinone biosynthesis [Neorhizobium galegae bv. officinalis bv. officinalis str. HAMBI 1141]|uniref:Methylase involved in ubiquinone/menaquinone biosynthesis n=1 Tax=Neorhizobium galegae bv. officinalis bv. officinalis str. HAMBI 1141 TaxID=1028801 RepID=A0A068T2C7_NEOGA|nr:class I SAM-dependent methyltransferase [Neorhizobium galegae]CDN52553.1 Methylase involved in ubiquinone/menaquinone biosynthesis [Neorhizobium galegae bv. officinalis bv. officinalis str. HAMBI 1141]
MVSESFNQLLNVFWLRPETALWRYLDIAAMRGFRFEGRSLDFGCGDGLFSFIRAGGQFSPSFDAFQKTDKLDQFYAKADVFDAYDSSYSPLVSQAPEYTISVGFDHKANLLSKASALGLYGETVEGDGNSPLPFADEEFQSIFSNIVYWLDEPAAVFAELSRVLKPGGKICLMLPNSTLPEYSFYNSLFGKTGDQQWQWLDLIDRGRLSDNIRQAKTDDQWRALFEAAGLFVAEHKQHLPKPIIQAWDIGFRPMFPALMKMVDAVRPDQRDEVKAEWVKTLKMFAEPLSHVGNADDKANAFHCYVLSK